MRNNKSKSKYYIKVLFLVEAEPIRGLSPASRFRVYQYVPLLENNGVKCKVLPSFPSKYFMGKRFWWKIDNFSPILGKFIFYTGILIMIMKRFIDLYRSLRYDIIFIQREILPVNFAPFLEKLFSKINKNIIFDFDDAIYFIPKSNKKQKTRKSFLKNILIDEEKIPKIIEMSKQIIVANKYLYNYAKEYHKKIAIIPTPVDTAVYQPIKKKKKRNFVIGWIGTTSNLLYLLDLEEIFIKLARKYDYVLEIITNKLDKTVEMDEVKVTIKEWNIESEVDDLINFDIGIMPLRDDEWTRGKSGFKALQYMAMEIPTIASPVGVNKEIIIDGENGFLASSTQDWINKLSLLIENGELRKKLGIEGRKTVEEKYSLDINTSLLLECFKKVVDF